MRTIKSPPDAIEEVWAYLEHWHADKASEWRADIEGRINILARLARRGLKGPQADHAEALRRAKICAALCVAVRIRKAHWRRKRHQEDTRTVLREQSRVLRDLDRVIKSLEDWNKLWGIDEHEYIDDAYIDVDGPGHNPLECLRQLRRDFPIIDGNNENLRLPTPGRPWLHKRPDDLLRRARVSKEERAALLKSLGLI